MVECPQCGSPNFKRVHARWYERALRSLIGLVPYRCQHCRCRAWQRHRELQSAFARRSAALVVSLIVVAFALTSFVQMRRGMSINESSSRDLPLAAVPHLMSLRLLSSDAYLSATGDFWHIIGQVKNVGDEPLTNVQVVSTWLNEAGKIVESRVDLVDLKRMMPGEVSPFTSVTRARPEMSTFRVQFESEAGQALSASTQ